MESPLQNLPAARFTPSAFPLSSSEAVRCCVVVLCPVRTMRLFYLITGQPSAASPPRQYWPAPDSRFQ
jgi:hypothetical protein